MDEGPLTKDKMSRIAREYKAITKLLNEDDENFSQLIVSMEPTVDLSQWSVLIRGPPETPYEDCIFQLHLQLPSDYPMAPPTVKFEPYSMPHCNVDFSTGEICLDILTREHWSPVWDMLHVVQAIGQLLGEPIPSSPLNVDIANILKANDKSAYYGLIDYYIRNR